MKSMIRRAATWFTMNGRISVEQPWVIFLGPLVLLGAIIAPYRWLFYLGYVFVLLILACYSWVRHLGPRIQLYRHHRDDWAQVGDTLVEHWLLVNTSALPLIWLEIDDHSTLPGYSARRVVFAGPGLDHSWHTTAECAHRGLYNFGPYEAQFSDPFGLFRYQWRDSGMRQVVIYPPLVRLPLLVPQGQRGGLARADLLQQHVTPSVGGLREYTPGDLPSRIHWPTVARRDTLMVKEFDQEQAGALWIAVDLAAATYITPAHHESNKQHTMETSESAIYTAQAMLRARSTIEQQRNTLQAESALELAVVLACSLAAQALAEGRSVGLIARDSRLRSVTPARGQRQLWNILSALVDAESTGMQPLDEVIRQGLAGATQTSRAALAIVTADLSGNWLPALVASQRGRPGGALALLVADGLQAAPLVERLAHAGVSASTYSLETPLTLLNPRQADTTMRVSPLGRVIHG